MGESEYSKLKLNILRVALFAIGAGMGFLALWQYFAAYPHVVNDEFRIVISVVTGALLGLIFCMSAKPVYRLIAGIVDALRSFGGSVGARGIIAVALGLAVAAGIVTGFDFGISLVMDIWAVRLLADILTYIVCAAGCCYGFNKLINVPRSSEIGYLISAECFTDERVVTAANALINAKVCDGAYKALCTFGGERGYEAVRLLDKLVSRGVIGVVRTGKDFDSPEAFAAIEKKIADKKRLRPVAARSDVAALTLDAFSPADETMVMMN